ADWSEVKYDVDPTGPPVEISLYLSNGQFILFDTIVLSVDNILPRTSPANACQESPAVGKPSGGSSPIRSISPAPGGSSTVPGIVSAGTVTTVTAPTGTTSGQCTVVPPTECKCNCLCNCNKC
ncbi:unnamed protein product, partial [Allacma fusca]